jgi:hypothetical protein
MARLRLTAVAFAAALATAATAFPARATTEPSVTVTVRVTLTDKRIVLSRDQAPRGTFVRFVVHNTGKKPHAFVLGNARHGIGRQTGFARTLRPGTTEILFLFLDYRGRLPYFGTLPAGHAKPAPAGQFTIV